MGDGYGDGLRNQGLIMIRRGLVLEMGISRKMGISGKMVMRTAMCLLIKERFFWKNGFELVFELGLRLGLS